MALKPGLFGSLMGYTLHEKEHLYHSLSWKIWLIKTVLVHRAFSLHHEMLIFPSFFPPFLRQGTFAEYMILP